MPFNEVELVKGYALPKTEGAMDYAGFHGMQRLGEFHVGIPGPAGVPGRGVPGYITQAIPALGHYGTTLNAEDLKPSVDPRVGTVTAVDNNPAALAERIARARWLQEAQTKRNTGLALAGGALLLGWLFLRR